MYLLPACKGNNLPEASVPKYCASWQEPGLELSHCHLCIERLHTIGHGSTVLWLTSSNQRCTCVCVSVCCRAKQYLPFLQRNGKMQGLVEFVLSGHRLKVSLGHSTSKQRRVRLAVIQPTAFHGKSTSILMPSMHFALQECCRSWASLRLRHKLDHSTISC